MPPPLSLSLRYIIPNLKRIGAVVIKKLTDTIYHVCPPLGQNRYPEEYEIHNFGRGLFALHHHAFSFSSTCVVVEKKIFENWSILGSFCPARKGTATMKFTIFVPLYS
jgi:hypothetical protein